MRMRKKDEEKEGKMQAFSYLAIGRRLSPENRRRRRKNEADEKKRERKNRTRGREVRKEERCDDDADGEVAGAAAPYVATVQP